MVCKSCRTQVFTKGLEQVIKLVEEYQIGKKSVQVSMFYVTMTVCSMTHIHDGYT